MKYIRLIIITDFTIPISMETSTYYFILFFIIFLFLKNNLQRINKRFPPSPGLCLPIKKPLYRTLAELSDKYGPILYVRYGSRPVILVSSPSAAEECFTKHDVAFANRPKLLAGKYLGYNYTTISWASYGSHWHNLRRIASVKLLSSNSLQMFHGICADEIWEEAKRFQQIVAESIQLTGVTNIGDFIPVLNYVGVSRLEKKLVILQKKKDKFLQDLINQHRQKQSDSASEQMSKTMVDVLLSLQGTEPEYHTDEIIRGMMHVSYLTTR
ncbi:putative oxidoreductase [Rosa chinensis]|uniref:Putative oxidoreductase n=1 Tax=Rosa chinensis TaxID=74649 RepID=A0A2P6Q0Y0_ROSCH|nr:putative oxidoreductase [Rosa chinensis]